MSELQKRVQAIDALRGLVMIIMALDHVRDFLHIGAMTADPLDPATTYPLLFFTRWITHFCAPTFVFLSGVSARLAGRTRPPAELSRFLISRGLWLIFVEVVIMTFGITFNPFYNVIILQVIWAIGTSMVFLGLLARASIALITALGCIIFFGHNLTDYVATPPGAWGTAYTVLLTSKASVFPISAGHAIFDLYAVLPWTGVMFLGYALGYYFQSAVSGEKRRRGLLWLGVGAISLFVLLRALRAYGEPFPWTIQKTPVATILSFLNTNKYPPSLQFLLMTLGPALILLTFLDNVQNRLTRILSVYGKVPFFYYVLHFYLVHLVTVACFYATGHKNTEIVSQNVPFFFRPVNFGFDLWVVYLIWAGIVCALYQPCLWFGRYKEGHKQWWLSYL